MKRNFWAIRVVLTIVGIMLISMSILSGNFLKVRAGVVENEASTAKTVLNKSEWRVSDGVEIAKNGILFSTTLSTARAVRNEKLNNFSQFGIEKCFDAQITLKINELPEYRKFGFTFGLPYISSTVGCEGSSLLYFSIDGSKLLCGLDFYTKEGETKQIIKKRELNDFAVGTIKIDILVNNDGSVAIVLYNPNSNENVLLNCDPNSLISGEGYFGFGYVDGVGNTDAAVISCKVKSYRYETPENMTYFEDFSDNVYNSAFFSGGSLGNIGVMKISNNRLVFDNTEAAFLSTRYSYSNAVVDLDVKLKGSQSAPIVVAIGAASCDMADRSAELIVEIGCENDAVPEVVFRSQGRRESIELPAWFNLWNNVENETLNIRIYCHDGIVKVMMKLSDEIGFSTVANYSLGSNTPNGKIQVQAYEKNNVCANY